MRSEIGEALIKEVARTKQTALDLLTNMADKKAPSGVGPLNVGTIKDLDSAKTNKAIAATYLKAFDQNIKTYPYLLS